ncbi:hypothetical protein B0H11DRAFT_2056994 [Mycena galericulata]|nr:hypothetical protein B0H11DRAFT_2056994 [Mycena galericulata]
MRILLLRLLRLSAASPSPQPPIRPPFVRVTACAVFLYGMRTGMRPPPAAPGACAYGPPESETESEDAIDLRRRAGGG